MLKNKILARTLIWLGKKIYIYRTNCAVLSFIFGLLFAPSILAQEINIDKSIALTRAIHDYRRDHADTETGRQLSRHEAAKRLAAMWAFPEQIEQVARKYKEIYSGIYFDNEQELALIINIPTNESKPSKPRDYKIYISGKLISEFNQLTGILPKLPQVIELPVRFEQVGISSKFEIKKAVNARLGKLYPKFTFKSSSMIAGVGYDDRTGGLIMYDTKSLMDALAKEGVNITELRNEFADTIAVPRDMIEFRSFTGHNSTDIPQYPQPDPRPDVAFIAAGMGLNPTINNDRITEFMCTAGFAVGSGTAAQEVSRLTGFVTAAHCLSETGMSKLKVEPVDRRSFRNFELRQDKLDQDADIALLVPVIPSKFFYGNMTMAKKLGERQREEFRTASTYITDKAGYPHVRIRRVTANVIAGSYVCKMGANLGLSCGTVLTDSFSPGEKCGPKNKPVICNLSFIGVEALQPGSLSGDSGGPVFFDENAIGLVLGGMGSKQDGKMIWTATNLEHLKALEVFILTRHAVRHAQEPRHQP